MDNALATETSPYLLQHKSNPVRWYPWGGEALSKAKRENKPILLSVGYAACHWCHVMAHESFEDRQTAELMNRFFINIKVDREERPDIDIIYQQALHQLGGQGGWPLTMFLTPEGEPFWGGTYFPREEMHGMPSFRDVLWKIANLWKTDSAQVQANAKTLRDGLKELESSTSGAATMAPEKITEVTEKLLQVVDPDHGGVGKAPKFPTPSLFFLFWQGWRRSGQRLFAAATRLTLDRMSQGGIYDHLGGGYARYAVDQTWLVPHFEKMLYDNAQILQLLTEVWRDTRAPLYEARVRETVHFILENMQLDAGGFASAFDADSEGEEGLFYTWAYDEVADVLTADEMKVFEKAYDVTPEGNFEGRNILNRGHETALDPQEDEKLKPLRDKLLAARNLRPWPARDDKVLADWNGLMITALAEAGCTFDEASWVDAAEKAFTFITENMAGKEHLHHSWRAGKLKNKALLDDYANMSRAALALYEATGDEAYLEWAQRWVMVLDMRFWDHRQGGCYQSADDASDLILRPKVAEDGATPSGNGVFLHVLARLYYLTGSPIWRKQAEQLFGAFSGGMMQNIFPYSTMLTGVEVLDNAVQVVLVGSDGSALEDMREAVYQASCPNRILMTMADTSALSPTHPAYGKEAIDGEPTAYVCVGTSCQEPAQTPEQLVEALNSAATYQVVESSK